MSRPPAKHDRSGDGGVDPLLMLLGFVFASAGAVWAGAQLAALVRHRQLMNASLSVALQALAKLPSHATSPKMAWPLPVQNRLPGPLLYWTCTLVMVVGTVALAVFAARLVRGRSRVGTVERRRLGIDPKARFATRRDLKSLAVKGPSDGRFILGRVHGSLVATERRDRTVRRRRRRDPRAGDRSSVAIIGASRCGKTANLISGILDWPGPAVVLSLKNDVVATTGRLRLSMGDVKVFDPTRCVDSRGLLGVHVAEARWTPLRGAGTVQGAKRAAWALMDAAPKDGAENLSYFRSMAEDLLWPILYTAAISGRSMADVVRWVMVLDRPTDLSEGEVAAILDNELTATDAKRRDSARRAMQALKSTWLLDERPLSSTYSTAKTMVSAWLDPDVEASSTDCNFDLGWLLDPGPVGSRPTSNTLYLCGPLQDQRRLSSVFGGLIGDLINQAFDEFNRTNRPLRDLLIVMDEAGNTPAKWLPEVLATCAGMGIVMVTVWQSKSQITVAFGDLADAVLTNSGTKIIYSGVSDPSTFEYVSKLVGDEEVEQTSTSRDVSSSGNRQSMSQSSSQRPLVPGAMLRQVAPGDALLIHGTLPPAHLRSRPWFEDRRLRRLVDGAAVTRPGRVWRWLATELLTLPSERIEH